MIHGLSLSLTSGEPEFLAQKVYVNFKSSEKVEQMFIQKVITQPIL
jgi:hypothetical protein